MSSTTSASASASTSAVGLVDGHANPAFKIVGICLAVGSGVFIGTSFVVKKKGLLASTAKHGNSAGEGHGYLKSWLWWTGMMLMVIGEILNFVAYAFTEAILVTPMGALSVVICAILSHFFLKESLTFFGWIGCILCIIGATILALNAPQEQSVTTINAFKHLFLSVGFLVWGSLLIAASLIIVFFVAPKYGKKNMMPYISICSLVGGISVSCTQGLGASIVTSIQGDNQVKNWFFWFLFIFVVITLLIEINYLNKALELFNFILYQGLKASAVTLITMVLGFLVICLGITLLQMSKVDPKQLTGLDRKSTMLFEAAQHGTEDAEKGEVSALEDPGMDALRGGFGAVGSIIRARSVSRRMSSASSFNGKRGHPYESEGNLSTHGLPQLQRFQLSDVPMPADAMDQISLHSGKSPIGPDGGFQHGNFPGPKRSKSHLKFEEADVVHQYGYGGDHDATHTSRPHPSPAPLLTSSNSGSGRSAPFLATRQVSSGSSYPPVMEESEEDAADAMTTVSGHGERASYFPDPYRQSPIDFRPRLDTQNSRGSSTSTGSGPIQTLSNLFHSHPERRDSEVRGGAHRGTRDYPHLPKEERDMENEERAALVRSDDEDERPVHRVEEQPRSAASDSSGSGGRAAGRKLPDAPRGPRPSGPR